MKTALSLRSAGTLSLLVAIPYLGSGCDGTAAPTPAQTTDASLADSGSGDGGGDDGGECKCGPGPMTPNYYCADGTVGGPTCVQFGNGTCGWQDRPCPPGSDAGPACTKSADCGAGMICGFKTADACSATGTCFVAQQVGCNAISAGCGCDGSFVNVVCNGLPSGYTSAPLLHTGACVDAGSPADGGDGGACCPASWDLYACTYPDGGAGSACHDPQRGCASSTTCGQGCDGVVTGRCAP